MSDSLAPLLTRIGYLETFSADLTTAHNEHVKTFNRSMQAMPVANRRLKATVVSLRTQRQPLAATIADREAQSQQKGWFR